MPIASADNLSNHPELLAPLDLTLPTPRPISCSLVGDRIDAATHPRRDSPCGQREDERESFTAVRSCRRRLRSGGSAEEAYVSAVSATAAVV